MQTIGGSDRAANVAGLSLADVHYNASMTKRSSPYSNDRVFCGVMRVTRKNLRYACCGQQRADLACEASTKER